MIGTDIVRFDLYGADYVIANKMESGGEPGRVNVSSRTKALLEDLETVNYGFEENKKIFIKSTGTEIQSYFIKLASKTGYHSKDSDKEKGKKKVHVS